VDDALNGLEIVADTYLSVSTPAQLALPELLRAGATVRSQIAARITRNLAALDAAAASVPAVTVPPPPGGWSAVVQVPATESEEALVVRLVEDDGVLVHPGYFFDFPRESLVVVSLLPEPAVFDTGIARLLSRVGTAP
jgi:alanine-synthesizing transaminase